jgi:glycosyltransferase involved in cell wall biosynthesis
MSSYVLITPAHNEERFLAQTIESVVRQTLRPAEWIIVNDASTDATADMVRPYCRAYPFIKLVTVERRGGRITGKKARAFTRGFEEVRSAQFDFVGNLDADISVEPDYFRQIVDRLESDPQLGIAGGMVHSKVNGKFVSQNVALDSVAGAIQMFRRKCFEEIGGYISMPYGGLDSAAEICARMKGWRVSTFPELHVLEHRRTGSAAAGPVKAKINEGRRMYSLGYHPFFFLFRCIYRLFERPPVIGAAASVFGYFSSKIYRRPFALPPDVVQHLRAEQTQKLRRLLHV